MLTDSLQQNRLDSPVRKALLVQRSEKPEIEIDLKAAENAIRMGDPAAAARAYQTAVQQDPRNNLLQLRLGLLLKDAGNWSGAMTAFANAIEAAPTYSDAYRELGIAQNKLYVRPKSRQTCRTASPRLKPRFD